MDITLNLYDMILLILTLITCYACKCYGYRKGIEDTVDYFHREGVIEVAKQDSRD